MGPDVDWMLAVVVVVTWVLRDSEETMGTNTGLVSAVMVVIVLVLGGCVRDPRDAPGCRWNTYRCNGDVLQICQVDAASRRNTWWDVYDCKEFGNDIGEAMVCVEADEGGEADCKEVTIDAGVPPDAGDVDAGPGCPLSEWRCHGNVVQYCDLDSSSRKTWWDVQNCTDYKDDRGEPLSCVEPTDDGLVPDCERVVADGGVADAGY